jgi:hypothetical protein
MGGCACITNWYGYGKEKNMGLFKSKKQRQLERDIQVRQGIAQIKMQIKRLSQAEKGFIDKARRAKQIGAQTEYNMLKQEIRRAIAGRRQLERQVLILETAYDKKNIAESFSSFAKSMNSVSKSIAEVFGTMDLAKTQQEFEKSMAQAQNMEERMNVFLDMACNTMETMETSVDESLASDDEIDRMIEVEAVHKERVLDDEIARGIKDIERELGKEK